MKDIESIMTLLQFLNNFFHNLYMGFSNGNLTSIDVIVQKGQDGERGIGFHLTADNHFR